MAFLRPTPSYDIVPEIRGALVRLRLPVTADYGAWAELRAASREHLRPFEPQWGGDELTRGAFRRRLRRYAHDVREDLSYPFFIFAVKDGAMLGGATLSNVRRGVSQTASLGYWIGRRHAGSGLMTDAVRALTRSAFADLKLHRIEAACLAGNAASIRVLEKCGFRHEGRARKYLRIAGEWQDHELFALIEDDVRPEVTA